MKKINMSKIFLDAIHFDVAILLIRIFMGGFMAILHGYSKWEKWDLIRGDFVEPFGMPTWFAAGFTIFAELFCCMMIVFGLFTRINTLLIMITMAVAAFYVHAGDALDDREGSITYLAAFTAIFLAGPGKYSLDYLIFRKKIN